MRAGFPGEVPNCAHSAFEAADGTAYTEVHHIQPLSEGGVDIPINVACLCALHHREVHHGRFASALTAMLRSLRTGEPSS
jgi:predicted HNH restriction endonuclease